MVAPLTNESHEHVRQSETAVTAAAVNTSEVLLDPEPAPPPISRLPVEMLREIFLHLYYNLSRSWDVSDERYFTRFILLLTRVCRLWRTIVISIPSVWTEINLRKPDFAAMCIKHSLTRPLSVQFLPNPRVNATENLKWRNPLFETSLARTLPQRTTELKSAIKWEDMKEFFDMLQNGGWQQLEKLSLTMYETNATTMSQVLDFRRWSLHNIRHLALTSFYLQLDSAFYGKNLTTVSIEKAQSMVVNDLLEFIRDHPHLENLSIHSVNCADIDWEREPVARFTHEKLSLLSLEDFLDSSAASYLFSKLFTDAYLELTYNAHADYSINPFPPEHPFKQRLHHLRDMCVQLDLYSLKFSHYTGPENFRSLPCGPLDHNATDVISFGFQSHWRHSLLEFAREYGSPHCKALVIQFNPSRCWSENTDTTGWTTILEHFSNLQSIYVTFNRFAADATSLFEAFVDNCPNMKSISLGNVSQETSFEVLQKYMQSLRQNGRGLLGLWLSVTGIVVKGEDATNRAKARQVRYETMLKPWVEKLTVHVFPYV